MKQKTPSPNINMMKTDNLLSSQAWVTLSVCAHGRTHSIFFLFFLPHLESSTHPFTPPPKKNQASFLKDAIKARWNTIKISLLKLAKCCSASLTKAAFKRLRVLSSNTLNRPMHRERERERSPRGRKRKTVSYQYQYKWGPNTIMDTCPLKRKPEIKHWIRLER